MADPGNIGLPQKVVSSNFIRCSFSEVDASNPISHLSLRWMLMGWKDKRWHPYGG